MVAAWLQKLATNLIIEFVPKEDKKVQLMLAAKKDIYTMYTEKDFEAAFKKYFSIMHKELIPGSGRTIYLMKRNEG